MSLVRSLALLSLVALCAATAPAPTPPTPATAPAGPKNDQGLTAAIVINKDTYAIPAGQAGKEFRDRLTAANAARGMARLPQPPAIDLSFRITNTTNAAVTITYGGDESQMNLNLQGPGAVTVDNNVAMTMEFRMGKPVTLAAGKSYDIKISSLAFGTRGISKYAYFTEPGEYTVTATLTYGNGEKQGTLASGPAKFKVTAP
jgi:hypothetical protein